MTGAVSYLAYRAGDSETEYSYIGESPTLSYTDTVVNGNEVESRQLAAAASISAVLAISNVVFRYPEANGTIISGDGNAITVMVPIIVNLTALTPVITHSGAVVNPSLKGYPRTLPAPLPTP